jgi:Ca2+-binding EF-hand superfamily protein
MSGAAVSDIRRERLGKAFRAFDHVKDGRLTRQDVDRFANELAERLGKSPSSPEVNAFRQGALHLHDKLNERLGKKPGSEITEEEYIQVAAKVSRSNIKDLVDPYVDGLFTLLDDDGDGKLTAEEFQYHHSAMGLEDREIRNAFRELDTDGDGTLSKEEFREYGYQFYLDSDPRSKANALAGEL